MVEIKKPAEKLIKEISSFVVCIIMLPIVNVDNPEITELQRSNKGLFRIKLEPIIRVDTKTINSAYGSVIPFIFSNPPSRVSGLNIVGMANTAFLILNRKEIKQIPSVNIM